MDFSKLRHRVIFLKPLDKRLNSMNENVPVWIPFKPKLSGDINADETSVYVLTDNKGNAVWRSAGGGQLYSHQLSLNEYAVWANVSPMSGREYEESQKLRAETTYKITTRYFPNTSIFLAISVFLLCNNLQFRIVFAYVKNRNNTKNL